MPQVTYQTVRLSRGRHASPQYGACVMELASMLAGEPFSDHPRAVSPAIAAFLRAYNDTIDDRRRQDLYEYAAKTVGTAAGPAVEALRTDRIFAWGQEMREHRSAWPPFGRVRRGGGGREQSQEPEVATRFAMQALRKPSSRRHAAALGLVDELIALGAEPGAPPAQQRPSEAEAHLSMPESLESGRG